MPVPARLFAGEPAPTSASAPKPFSALPVLLQAYIALSTIAAVVIIVWQAMDISAVEKPERFYPVLVTSVVLAATKIRLPLLPSSATVSLSYCTNFAALSLFSPFAATFIIAVSVWAQCALNNAGRMATYRTVYSIANIILASKVSHMAASRAPRSGCLRVTQKLPPAHRINVSSTMTTHTL